MATALKQDIETLKKDLRTLRDQVKLKVHLGTMEVKDEWKKLEPEADRAFAELTDATVEAAQELKRRLIHLRDGLKH